jgi:hypothetical protein
MSGALVRASFWDLPAGALASHLQQRRQEAATAVVPFYRPAAAGKALALSRPRARLTFKGFDDFMPQFRASRAAAIAEHGEQWWANPAVCRKGRVPTAWVTWRGKASSGSTYRDLNMPMGRYWPSGEMPLGPDYADPICVAQFVEPAPRRRATIDLPAWEWIADAAD